MYEKSSEAKRLLFIVNDLYTNTFKLVHDLALVDPFFLVKVVATSSLATPWSPMVSQAEISAFLTSQDIKHQRGISNTELMNFAPDWIFVSRPYNDYAEPHLVSSELSQFGKIAHLSYGSTLIQWVNEYQFLRDNPFLADSSAFFVGSELEFPGESKFIPVGQLKLDEYIQKKRTISSFDSPSIVWKPRWTLEDTSALNSHLSSLLKLVKTGDLQVVFVMHPLLVTRLEVANNDSLHKKLTQFLSHPKVYLSQGPFYLDSALGADVFFGDTSSTLAEFACTKKPVIWNRPPIDSLNELGRSVLMDSHVSNSVIEFEETLYRILEKLSSNSKVNQDWPPQQSANSSQPSAASKVLEYILDN
jgi:hypothetical protein